MITLQKYLEDLLGNPIAIGWHSQAQPPKTIEELGKTNRNIKELIKKALLNGFSKEIIYNYLIKERHVNKQAVADYLSKL